MAVTRINNNQITDASAGNVYLGINANTKLQNYSITSNKIANNLTYGSDLTVSGNLTVNGSSTAIDTTITTIEDPVIVLASTQTGAPAVDIGFIGERGTSENIAFVWDESAGEFVTVFTSTSETNTTITITGYANAHVGNMVVGGTTSLSGNVIGAANFTNNVTGGNLLTAGNVSATGNMIASNFIGNISGNISAAGANTQVLFNDNGTANATSGFTFDKTSNLVTVGGNVDAQNFNGNVFGTTVSASGTVTAASTVGGVITGTSTSVTGTQTAASTVGGVITGSSVSVTGTATAASTVGGVIEGSSVSVTGTATAASTVGGVITGSSSSVTGTQTAASTVGGVITGSSVSVTGNVNATDTNSNVYGTTVSASGTVTAASTVGGVITGSSVSVTGTATAASTVGGVITGSSTSVTGTQTAASTVGGVITGSSVSVTANVTGGNLVSSTVTNPTVMTISTNAGNINLEPTGNIVVNNTYINGLQLTPQQDGDAASKYYVDTIATTGLTFHEAVFATTNTTLATATGGTITYAQPNGVANGIGATLTTTGTFNLIDTANVQTPGTRILVKDQANAVQNGIYVYSNATVITRSTDADQYGSSSTESLSINDYFFTTNGNVNAGAAFVVDAPAGTITFGTSNITFAQFSSSQTYTANTSAGLVLVNQQFNAKVDNNTTAFDGLGNISVKAGANLTTPNIGAATGTSLSVTGTVTAASTVGGVITGSSVSVTGGVDAASVAGGVITGTSSSVTGTQTAASTVGGVITGSSTSVTGTQTAASTVGGVITGSSVSVTGNVDAGNTNSNVYGTTVSATGNITGGNLLTSGAGGAISGTGNITGGNILTSGNVSATGNVMAAWLIGNIQGSVSAPGANTEIIFNDGGVSNATAGFTFNKPSNLVTVGGNVNATNFNGNVFGTSVSASGTVTAASTVGGVITGSSASVTGTVTAASTVGGVITGSSVSVTGDVSGSNLSISGGNINSSAAAITVNGTSADVNFAVNGDTTTIFFADAGTETASFGSATQTTNAIVAFNSTNSILAPVGNTAQRPATGVTGMLRFNTTNNAVEVYDNSAWVSVGVPVFTVIADQQFNGDGTTVNFTLGSTQTTNSCIVSINGVVQIPTLAYAVAGTDPTCVLTFTEAPAVGDVIDVRQITTTTTVTSIANQSGNAVVAASDTAAQVNVTGDLSVSGTILGGNLNSTAITFGTSNMSVVASGGNIRANIAGTTVQTISPGLVAITGDLSVSGNATLSGNILGDRIQNGTTQIDIQTPGGNANINIGGTGNLAVFSPGALNMTGNIIPTANVTYNLGSTTQRWNDLWLANSTIYLGNSQISANATSLIFTNPQGGQTVLAGATAGITGATVSVTGAVTAASVVGGVITGSSLSVTGTINGTTVTGTSLTVSTGNITGGNLILSGAIEDSGQLDIRTTASNGNIVLTPNGTGNVNIGANIMPTANATANIGSATSSFNTIFAKATSAQYADLAEKYTADADYAPGTVVVFGGTHEVTVNATDADRKVAGVVSTNPSYIMNGGLEGEHVATVALTGRVPTLVVGPVRKGDMMVAAGLGRARAEADPQVGTVIGKALEDFDGAEGTIEVVVGRF
jgi:fibronectin-binding autotransporter adhesin